MPPLSSQLPSADDRASQMMQFCSKVPVVTYSTVSRTADVYARTMKYNAFETEVEVCPTQLSSADYACIPDCSCCSLLPSL